MLSLIHCSDVHLDTPMTLYEYNRQNAGGAELRTVFSSMMQYVREHKVPLLLIAGDLFGNAFVTKETVLFLKREFAAAQDCRIVIAPGADDACTPVSPYLTERFSDNVYVFRSPEVTRFSFPELRADVYGIARCPLEELPGSMPLAGFSVSDKNAYNIFCASADLSGNARNGSAPVVTKEQLVRAGIDYAALGGLHNAGNLRRAAVGDTAVTYFAYSGCLAGRDFDEPGYKSAIRAELAKTALGVPNLNVGRLRFSRRHFETLEADISGCRDIRSAADVAARRMQETDCNRETVLRLILTGTTAPSLYLEEKTFRPLLPALAGLQLLDRTVPDPDAELLSSDPTLRGAFYEELRPMLENGTDEEKETARLALRMGLSALAESGHGHEIH